MLPSDFPSAAKAEGLPPIQQPLSPVMETGPEKFIPILSASAHTNPSITVSSIEKSRGSQADMAKGYGKAVVPPDVTIFRIINRVYPIKISWKKLYYL